MSELDSLRQSFREQLLCLVNNLQVKALILQEAISIEQLATLTKLVVRHREYLRGIKLEQPIIVVVLHGIKTIYLDDREYIFQPGELFLVPAAIALDVVNQLDSNSHSYIALVLELGDNLIARIRQAYPELVHDVDFGHSSQIELDIPLTSQLAQSFVYLVQTVVNNTTENSSYLHEHRLMEVILLLLQSNRRSQFLKIIYPDFLTYVTNLISRDLSFSWSTAQVAQELNISVSTLKRKLKYHNLTFGQVITQARMQKGMRLLQENKYAISEIALACGYESPSRFAARFRQYYYLNPSEVSID
ncbi:MAG: helix-turn-helix domain-containing protein [Waterburya sp.]